MEAPTPDKAPIDISFQKAYNWKWIQKAPIHWFSWALKEKIKLYVWLYYSKESLQSQGTTLRAEQKDAQFQLLLLQFYNSQIKRRYIKDQFVESRYIV